MHRLELDFATPQRSVAASQPKLSIALLIAGIAVLGGVVWELARQTEDNTVLATRRDMLASRHQRQQTPAPMSAELAGQFDQANAAHAQLIAPWEDILQGLEQARNDEIGLLALIADAARQELTLSGEARDFAALSAFADRLASNALFQQVTVTNHKLSDGAPPVVVRFDLQLRWRRGNAAKR